MKNNTLNSSSLRNARNKTNQSLYNELSLELLALIGSLTYFQENKKIDVSKLKSKMGVTYSALAKMITILKENNYIKISLSEDNTKDNELAVSITKAGMNKVVHINIDLSGI